MNRSTAQKILIFPLIAAAASSVSVCRARGPSQSATTPAESARAIGFEEVTGAKDGERVKLTDWIDEKFLCHDVTETQRDICTTALTRSSPPDYQVGSLHIRLRVCSDERRRNCIVMVGDPRNTDLRDIFVYDDNGKPIDFDGAKFSEEMKAWVHDSVKLKLTGRVTVVNGQGRLLEPIEKIEAEEKPRS